MLKKKKLNQRKNKNKFLLIFDNPDIDYINFCNLLADTLSMPINQADQCTMIIKSKGSYKTIEESKLSELISIRNMLTVYGINSEILTP